MVGVQGRLATRLFFLIAGFGVSCWAPLVPFAQQRLAADSGVLGMLLLCLGLGSIAAMSLTGVINARFGNRAMILGGSLGICGVLPLLALADSPQTLGPLLFLFGASLGSLDVAMNIHAVEVERAADRPLMSGFHALYSIGGFAGSAYMTLLLSVPLRPLSSTLTASALMLLLTAIAAPQLLPDRRPEPGSSSVLPRGSVWLLALLTCIIFLAEGAVLDWSAVLLTSSGLVAAARGGLGYMLFSVAMTIGRLTGDAIVSRFGDKKVLLWGSVLAALGFVAVASAGTGWVALSGFVLIGAGASNIVPVLFRRAGRQSSMPPELAVAALATIGYAGILAGPAAIGWVAKYFGLPAGFWLLAALAFVVAIAARRVTRD